MVTTRSKSCLTDFHFRKSTILDKLSLFSRTLCYRQIEPLTILHAVVTIGRKCDVENNNRIGSPLCARCRQSQSVFLVTYGFPISHQFFSKLCTHNNLRVVLCGHQKVVFRRQKRTTFDVKNSTYFTFYVGHSTRQGISLCQIE